MKPTLTAALALTLMLGACADWGADVTPILDGAPTAHYRSDLAACRQLAREQSQLESQTVASAAIGGVLGGVLGEAYDAGDALGGAVVGALVGAAAGAAEASDAREGVVLNCLRGRGHPVVG
jgi:uncharacterized protein YcfJ